MQARTLERKDAELSGPLLNYTPFKISAEEECERFNRTRQVGMQIESRIIREGGFLFFSFLLRREHRLLFLGQMR